MSGELVVRILVAVVVAALIVWLVPLSIDWLLALLAALAIIFVPMRPYTNSRSRV